MVEPMKLSVSIAATLALLVALSVPAQAARCTAEQDPARQAAAAGYIQVAGSLLSE